MKKMLLSILSLILISGISISLAAKPAKKKPAAPAASQYNYAYAQNDCAPWDGTALKITLQQKPYEIALPEPGSINPPQSDVPKDVYPHYLIYLYPERFKGPIPLNEWVALPDVLEDKGTVSFCSQAYHCDRIHGVIKFSRFDKDAVEGEVLIDMKTFMFQAPMLHHTPQCG